MPAFSPLRLLKITRLSARRGLLVLAWLLLLAPALAQMPPSRLVPFRRGSLWGYADQHHRLVLPLRYDDAGPFIDDIAWVRRGANFGYITPDGSPLTPPHFTRATNFHHGRATVELQGETYQIDRAGNHLTAPPDSTAETDFLEQGDLVRRNGKVGFRFSVGHAVVPAEYDEIRDSYNGLLLVRRGAKWGVINQKGQLVLPLEYDAIRATPANGYAFPIIEQTGRFGYLAPTGKLLVKPQYREAQPFVAGTARVLTESGQAGYIDTRGREFFEE
ncbi:KWG Leptospira repeat protein [Hymenobacter roseosalivarius DSM 11622]|uniref:KWG Leptospira repeat protein n=1 Tax=Hymenobacter roseosalivarius DSM 11622 TaxID=645990 RepID=A0A1W1VLK7_9BACT|nr:WG repeat-containing protein [Hymenobacter roseosalivarius]SMB94265.1 KWG Leptospira repeat protein [Hymenobacter roseosalivarius DSM 11622]